MTEPDRTEVTKDEELTSSNVQDEGGTSGEETQFERKWTKRSTNQARASTIADPPSDSHAAELAREKARADELFERLQRAMADLSNYRKRAEAEREEMAKFASMLLVAEILPVLDNFERALAAIPSELQQFTWLQGVVLIERHLRAILERQGLETIEATGKQFNPSLHDAIVEEATSEADPGTIVADMQTGYTMHGRVLRPSLVKVARAADHPSTDAAVVADLETADKGARETPQAEDARAD